MFGGDRGRYDIYLLVDDEPAPFYGGEYCLTCNIISENDAAVFEMDINDIVDDNEKHIAKFLVYDYQTGMLKLQTAQIIQKRNDDIVFLEIKKFFRTRGTGISIAVVMLCMLLNSINNAGLLNKYKKWIKPAGGEDTTKYENELLDAHAGIVYSEEKYKEMRLVSESLYEGTDSEGESGMLRSCKKI